MTDLFSNSDLRDLNAVAGTPVPDQVPQLPLAQVESLLAEAIQYHQGGDLPAAVERYGQVLAQHPTHADALHLLGFAAFQQGDFPTAVRSIRAAILSAPHEGEYHFNLALAYLALGDIDQMVVSIRSAQRFRYMDLGALRTVSWQLAQYGKTTAAKAGLEQCRAFEPNDAETLQLLGIVYKQCGQFPDAIACYERSIELAPNQAAAYINLGNAWRDQDQPQRSLAYYDRALEIDPTFAAAHNNLGVAKLALDDLAGAAEAFQHALQLDPGSEDVLNNLGNLHRELNEFDEALRCFERAIRHAPENGEILNNLGMTLRQADRRREAVVAFERALQVEPQRERVVSNLAATLLELGEYGSAASRYREAAGLSEWPALARLRADMICPETFADSVESEQCWDRLNDSLSRDPLPLPAQLHDLPFAASQPPFYLQFFPHDVCDFKRRYAAQFAQLASAAPQPSTARRAGRIRIGMVVTDGHDGIFCKSLRGVINRLDRSKLEIHILCRPSAKERMHKDLLSDAATVSILPKRLDQAAEMLRNAAFDLLYYWEIGTDPANYFLPFLRLAPVQCTSWGIQVTSGIPNVDYYLSNELVEPADGDRHYTEQLLRARCLLSYRSRPTGPPPVASRSTFGLQDRDHIYTCAQQAGKLHPDFDATLAAILRNDAAAKLVLTVDPNRISGKTLQARHQRRLHDVADRIIYLPRLDYPQYRDLLQISDVLLDPPYFGGVNSTYDGLACGKPIVTCPGPFHRGRYTWGCYRQMQFDACVVKDASEYVALALRLGKDANFRAHVNAEILARHELLFEDDNAVREHERLFLEMIERGGR